METCVRERPEEVPNAPPCARGVVGGGGDHPLSGDRRLAPNQPQATWDDLEATVDAEFAVLRAKVLQDTTLASDAVDLRTVRPPVPGAAPRSRPPDLTGGG